MVTFHNAKRYPAKNAIFAPQVLEDYLQYKGNPTFTDYWLPLTTNSLGFCVVRTLQATGGCTVSAYADVDYYGSNLIASGRDNINTAAYYYDNEICLNYQTSYFRAFLPASNTGKAYQLYKGTYNKTPRLMLSALGNWNEIRDRYDDYAVVLTNVTKYENSKIPRPMVSNAYIYSVSDVFGRAGYNADGSKYPPTNSKNQNKNGGYWLFQQLYQFSGTKFIFSQFSWLEQYEKMGAEVIIFDNSDIDKTGEPAGQGGSNQTLCIIFRNEKDIKSVGNSIGVPFVVNDEDTARNGDINDFPDYEKPGVPNNETGGGDGLGDNSSDNVDNPDNPQLSPVGGGNNLYCMTEQEMEKTFKFLWDGHNKEILGITISEANIIDCLCNCFYLPFDISVHDPGHCIAATVEAGGYLSEIQSVKIVSGYNKRFDFGDLAIDEYYGTFLDYSPYTTVNIYLPYIGFKALDVSKCMGKTINVTYGVDFAQGIATAYISYYEGDNKQVFAEYSGQMGIPIKVTGRNTSAVEDAVKDAAFSLVGLAVAAVAVAATPATGGASLAATGLAASSIANFGSKTFTATTVQADSVSVGNAGAENWLLSPQGCYVHIQRARTATPENFADINGWATRYTGLVSEFTGYLECSEVVNTVNTTAEEKNLITTLLKQGVYV